MAVTSNIYNKNNMQRYNIHIEQLVTTAECLQCYILVVVCKDSRGVYL